MAHDDPRPGEATDDSADTASFKRFVDDDTAADANDSRVFRLLTLVVGLVVLVAIIALLLL